LSGKCQTSLFFQKFDSLGGVSPLNAKEWKDALASQETSPLKAVYKENTQEAATRFIDLIDQFTLKYPNATDLHLFSAPGRTEISGNHTDHQQGRVLAAAVNRDTIGVGAKTDEPFVRISSAGHSENRVNLDTLTPIPAETGMSNSLIRGVIAFFQNANHPIGGFSAVTSSQVGTGSGVSSSAAFEVLVGGMLDSLYGQGNLSPLELAQAGQYAENTFYGKPSGLMDQAASACGGLVTLDFADATQPKLRRLDIDFSQFGHALCLTGPIGTHANLTDEYAAIPAEMRQVASALGASVLSEISRERFYEELPSLRDLVPTRALLRAGHFYDEQERVLTQCQHLENGNFQEFLHGIWQSGYSSAMWLQNVFVPQEQGISLALMIARGLLGTQGAARVHGGGFAGTMQAFVPLAILEDFRTGMDRVFGDGACQVYSIRNHGFVCLG
jgi:galactokinase